jgi:hypothetical protein
MKVGITNRWFEAGLEPTYFDWPTSVKDGRHSFIDVQNAIENHSGRLPSYRGERR